MKKRKLKVVDWTSFSPAPVIGVDEVGRGCLAGPVVAAAVILSAPSKRRKFYDSKLLSEKRREELLFLIESQHVSCLGFASVEEIDRINILHASLLAMRRAVEGLALKMGGHVLVDGKFVIPDLCTSFAQTALIQGDLRAECISAASILAKVTRDRFMTDLSRKYPGYGFEIHKGYATHFHRTQLASLGPTPFHRRSFKGCDEEFAPGITSEDLPLL